MPDTAAPSPVPNVFTRAQIGWEPFVEPLSEAELTPHHIAALIDAARAKSEYFRLLARDPDALEHRTRTDKDIFYNPTAGAPRADRELAAAAVSRFNGCIYCCSVHARFAATYAKREADVDKLLAEGVGTDIGERWNAVVAAAVALTVIPMTFGPEHVTRLRAAGMDDLAISDIIQAASFFNWANRLMLSLGEASADRPPNGAAR